jgi:hypothetical protein
MSNVLIGAIGAKTKSLKDDVRITSEVAEKLFNDKIYSIIKEARRWLYTTRGDFDRKLDSKTYLRYLDKFEKERDRILVRNGINPNTASFSSDFGDYMS